MGPRWGAGGVEEGGGCDVFINKKQLCMMLTAGWSAPRPNPALLLLTFQHSGAYPRQCAQSSLSRSGSVQGSGGGRPWLSLSYPVLRNTLKQRGLPYLSRAFQDFQGANDSSLIFTINEFGSVKNIYTALHDFCIPDCTVSIPYDVAVPTPLSSRH